MNMAVSKKYTSEIRVATRRVARVHFLYIFALAIQLIIFDSGQLITPKMVMRRWFAIGGLTLVTTIVWYIAKNRSGQPSTFKKLIFGLILSDIAFASYYVYISRGMASKAVLLYAIPILVASVLERRSALLATAVLCMTAYIATCISYFVVYFNEGYKLELYGEIGFYCVIFIVLAAINWSFIRRKSS